MKDKTVNPDLYDFLKDRECGLYQQSETEIIAYVFIEFDDLDEFQSIVGRSYFSDDGGVECKLQEGHIWIEINDIVEYSGQYISSYQKCFREEDWKRCEKYILEMEE